MPAADAPLCAAAAHRRPPPARRLPAAATQALATLYRAHRPVMLLAAGALTAAQLAAITLVATLVLAIADRLLKRWKVGGQRCCCGVQRWVLLAADFDCAGSCQPVTPA